MNDPVNNPLHYTNHPSGVECIQITEHMTFNVGNAIKYLWRAGIKDERAEVQDLEKAKWYIQREIDRLSGKVVGEICEPWKNFRKPHTKATRHEWKGGDRPVDPDALVAVLSFSGAMRAGKGACFCWDHIGTSNDIVAYWELES